MNRNEKRKAESGKRKAESGKPLDVRLALKLRIAAAAGPLVDQAVLGGVTGRVSITVDFAAGRPLLIVPSIEWTEQV